MSEESIQWFEALERGGIGYDNAYQQLRLFIMKSLTKGMRSKPGVSEAFLEDVTQDSCLIILKKLGTFQGRSKFSSWALSIAIRVALSEFRKKQWNNVSLDELKERGASFESPSLDDPYQKTVLLGAVDTLHDLIKHKLSDRQKSVLTAELNGMPQDEIARQLETTRNSIYKVSHDSRRILKRELQKAGYDQESVIEMLNK